MALTSPPTRRIYRSNDALLVVEVVSPGSAIYDRNTKADTYGPLGVRELWLIDEASGTVELRAQAGSGFGPGKVFNRGEAVGSSVFPDLAFRTEELFED